MLLWNCPLQSAFWGPGNIRAAFSTFERSGMFNWTDGAVLNQLQNGEGSLVGECCQHGSMPLIVSNHTHQMGAKYLKVYSRTYKNVLRKRVVQYKPFCNVANVQANWTHLWSWHVASSHQLTDTVRVDCAGRLVWEMRILWIRLRGGYFYFSNGSQALSVMSPE
jgi:hypothetical protein